MPEAALHVGSGKVRELVASDRISTFDVVLPTEIPDKGRVLTGLSAFWFARTRHICANHLLSVRADGRSLECRRLEMLPIEHGQVGVIADRVVDKIEHPGIVLRVPARHENRLAREVADGNDPLRALPALEVDARHAPQLP